MLSHDYIGTEHLLLALIHEGQGVAAKALESLDIRAGTAARSRPPPRTRRAPVPSGFLSCSRDRIPWLGASATLCQHAAGHS
jgi:ATP-dependent Clp protease ATP-binding subunit ClpA